MAQAEGLGHVAQVLQLLELANVELRREHQQAYLGRIVQRVPGQAESGQLLLTRLQPGSTSTTLQPSTPRPGVVGIPGRLHPSRVVRQTTDKLQVASQVLAQQLCDFGGGQLLIRDDTIAMVEVIADLHR